MRLLTILSVYRYGYYDRFIAKQLNIFLFEYLHIKQDAKKNNYKPRIHYLPRITPRTYITPNTRLQNTRAIQMIIRNIFCCSCIEFIVSLM